MKSIPGLKTVLTMHFCDAQICSFILCLSHAADQPRTADWSLVTLRVKKKRYLVKAKVLFDCIGREEHFSVASYDKQKTV